MEKLKESFRLRRENFDWLAQELQRRMNTTDSPLRSCRIIQTIGNKMSIAIKLPESLQSGDSEKLTAIGSALFLRRVSGPRVVAQTEKSKKVDYLDFKNFGAHNDDFSESYLTAAVAVGSKHEELRLFIARLEEVLKVRLSKARRH